MIDRAPGCDIGRSRINIRLDDNLLTSFIIAILMVQSYVVLRTFLQDNLIGPAFSFSI